jgi:hypothetical protein
VIPIRFSQVAPGYFTDDAKYGGLRFDPTEDWESQVASISDIVCKRLISDRDEAERAQTEEETSA